VFLLPSADRAKEEGAISNAGRLLPDRTLLFGLGNPKRPGPDLPGLRQ
jgi:hypothetical protein